MGQGDSREWYAVRCLIAGWHAAEQNYTYEERVTVWRASSFADAISKAEAEAEEYAETFSPTTFDSSEVVDLAQAFWLFEPPADGAEVFSLMRDSDLAPDEYADAFFRTGREHEGESSANATAPRVTIQLERDLALVLFEWLAEGVKKRRMPEVAAGTPEYWALNDILASLETKLVEPFRPDFGDLLGNARDAVARRYAS